MGRCSTAVKCTELCTEVKLHGVRLINGWVTGVCVTLVGGVAVIDGPEQTPTYNAEARSPQRYMAVMRREGGRNVTPLLNSNSVRLVWFGYKEKCGIFWQIFISIHLAPPPISLYGYALFLHVCA